MKNFLIVLISALGVYGAVDPVSTAVKALATSGSATVYAGTPSPAISAYVAGNLYQLKIDVANTGSATVNLGPSAVAIDKVTAASGLAALSGSEMQIGQYAQFIYNGTLMILLNPSQVAGGGGGGQALATTDFGDWIGEAPSAATVTASSNLVPNFMYVPNPYNSRVITKVNQYVVTGSASTNARIAVYDLSGNLVGQSASVSTASSGTFVTYTFSPSVTITASGFYFAIMGDNTAVTFLSQAGDTGNYPSFYNVSVSGSPTFFYTTAQGSLTFPSTIGSTRTGLSGYNVMPASRGNP